MTITAQITQLWSEKFGNTQEEYEDAFAPQISGEVSQDTISIAVADGATESSFAGEWARMLTNAFVSKPFLTTDKLKTLTGELSKEWNETIANKELPWYAEEKVLSGAFSTLIGIHLLTYRNYGSIGSWSAIAIGDSCLFQIRNDKLVYKFPIDNSSQFNDSPLLLSSNLSLNSQLWEEVKIQEKAFWLLEDVFILATDAISKWFLSKYENGEKPWDMLLKFTMLEQPNESFKEWINELRKSSELKNDDVTVVIIKMKSISKSPIQSTEEGKS